MKVLSTILWVGVIFLVACSGPTLADGEQVNTVSVSQSSAVPSATPTPEPTNPPAEPTASPTEPEPVMLTDTPVLLEPTATDQPTVTLAPDGWKQLPVVPIVSERVKDIYWRGVALGNNPQAFSKIGDCGSTPAWFLGDFDRGPRFYSLGEHIFLEPVIQEFQGSYARTSLAAKSGFNASSILSPFWADAKQCLANETPLACEYRVHRPMFAFIMLGTNDVYHPDEFEPQMRKIIEYSIENGVIPILSTKLDNLEKDESINATIARLAREYDIPLLNYWLAAQPLPNHGLQGDGAHITYGQNRFDDPQVMEKGWPVRNLTALQALDAVWKAVTASP